jgi:hypothetical protein
MSIRSLTDLAVKRDLTPPHEPVRSDSPDRIDQRESVRDTLVSAIPAEVVLLYTAVTGGTLATEIVNNSHSYMPYRWCLLVFAIVLTPVSVIVSYRRKFYAEKKDLIARAAVMPETHLMPNTSRWPWLEVAASTLAAAAWFTVLPGSPLLVNMSRSAAEMTSVAVIVGTAAVMWLGFGRPLSTGSLLVPAPAATEVPLTVDSLLEPGSAPSVPKPDEEVPGGPHSVGQGLTVNSKP